MNHLTWLAAPTDWKADLKVVAGTSDVTRAMAIARQNLDFIQTAALDRRIAGNAALTAPLVPLKLAILSSSTVEHLLPSLRVAALRLGFQLTIHRTDYGQYMQELLAPDSALAQFAPDVVLVAFDVDHVLGTGPDDLQADGVASVARALEKLRAVWSAVRQRFPAQVIQQTLLNTTTPLLGGNEHRLAASRHAMTQALNTALATAGDAEGVDLLAMEAAVHAHGLAFWHDRVLWHRAKQEISPKAAPLFAELVFRLIAARRGRSAKCLVLDLDNTLWGGVIGDDGLQGIALGQGSALGEAFTDFQRYVAALARRGVILAVCSKNDERNALEPFEKHPEMVLRRTDIGCFMANWEDKASNLRRIAAALNIGLDALVFVDDNPFERNQVRQQLPMVHVPEMPEDVSSHPAFLAAAGYFEAVTLSAEDLVRTDHYRLRAENEKAMAAVTDLDSYLRGLAMVMGWRAFDHEGLNRIVQLINKTNQFNLTTRRLSEAEITAMIGSPTHLTLQLRLSDANGDHGMISVVIGALDANHLLTLDVWLMSCRVLGRGVEKAAFNLLVQQALARGVQRIRGLYFPTPKNQMVEGMYGELGFTKTGTAAGDATVWEYDVSRHVPLTAAIDTKEF